MSGGRQSMDAVPSVTVTDEKGQVGAVVASPTSPYGKPVRTKLKCDERFRHDIEVIESKIDELHSGGSLIPTEIVYRQKKAKKILFFEMKIKRIAEINTSQETFRCRFHIYFTWLASKEECDIYDELKAQGKKYDPEWKPVFSWSNAIQMHETDVINASDAVYKIKDGWSYSSVRKDSWNIEEKSLGFSPGQARWNRVKYDYDILFAEELELPAFPFDCQDFTMYLKVDSDRVEQCDIVPFPRHTEFCLLDPEFSVLSEWDFENLVCEFYKTDSVKSKSSKEYSLVGIHVKASRRWEAHIGHIIVIFCMFTLGLGSFSQGLIDDELGSRLGYCVTLLLADVATLQFLFDNLPNIPYWTIFDIYIYACFAFLFLVTGWTALAGYQINQDRLVYEDYDEVVGGIALGMHVIIHGFFAMRAMHDRWHERQKLRMTSIELEQYFKNSKTDRDRRAIAAVWDSAFLFDKNTVKDDPYGIFVKGAKKDKASDGRSIFSLPASLLGGSKQKYGVESQAALHSKENSHAQ